jgi:multidrug efflux system membrane fusion protein
MLVTVWIGSGLVFKSPSESIEQTPPVPTVATRWSEAQTLGRQLVLYGDVEPVQIARVRARTEGIVEQQVAVGQRVEQGDVIARLSIDDREVRLAQARAQLASAQRDFAAIDQLIERQLASDSERQLRLAQLEAARAALRAVELDIEHTQVKAPINGVVSRILADQGSYISAGGELVELVDNDPLIAVVQVQQATVAQIQPGLVADVRFMSGETRQGQVRFVAPIGEAQTRTFRVEISIDNQADHQAMPLPSGLSVEVIMEIEQLQAHQISPAIVRLDAQGRAGVYLVNQASELVFKPIDIVRADGQALWVSGLDQRVQLVTLSQAALVEGQQVKVGQLAADYSTLPARLD